MVSVFGCLLLHIMRKYGSKIHVNDPIAEKNSLNAEIEELD